MELMTNNAIKSQDDGGYTITNVTDRTNSMVELLKECKEHLITYKRDDLNKGYVVYDGSYLVEKIDQALGEDK